VKFTTTPSNPQVTLKLDEEKRKDLVKKNDPDEIGTSYLDVFVNGLPANQNCILKQIGGESYGIYGNSYITYTKPVLSLKKDINEFQLQCTNSANNSAVVEVKGQSGTLSTPASCIIPLDGNKCDTQTINWDTINPKEEVSTTVFLDNESVPVFTQNSGPGDLNIYDSGITPGTNSKTITIKTTNKVDPEYTGQTFVTNVLATKLMTVSCADGSNWSGSKCISNVINKPDLIASITSPTTVLAGTTRAFSSTIKNQGDANTNYEGVNTFINLFQTATGFDDPTTFVGPIGLVDYATTPMTNLTPGATAVASRSILLSPAGTYYMRACADKANRNDMGVINESKEIQNCSPWVTVNATPDNKPDLIAGVTSPTAAVIGVGSTYTALITNQGTASTGRSFNNLFQTATGFDDPNTPLGVVNYQAPSAMTTLAAGRSSTATSPVITFNNVGNYYMRACADLPASSPGPVTESNEENNCGDWSVVVVGATPTIDLKASAPSPSFATIGIPMKFTSMISNYGNTTTGNSFYNTFQVATGPNGTGTLTRIDSTPKPMPALGPHGLAQATSVNHTFTGFV
jgi:hypothetical protein